MFGNPQLHESQVREYFNNFVYAKRDNLGKQLADNVVLTDWDINVTEKPNVLQAFDNIWAALTDISVVVESMDFIGGKAYCTIQILADELEDPLNVLDVIAFDDDNLICSITAYKR